MRIAIVPLLVASLAACAGNTAPAALAGNTGVDQIVLNVDNSTSKTVRIYALHAGGETPLGRVSALSERTVSLPGVVRGTLRLVARPAVDMGRDSRYVTEPISVVQGQALQWRLQESPGISDVPHLSTVKVLACVRDC